MEIERATMENIKMTQQIGKRLLSLKRKVAHIQEPMEEAEAKARGTQKRKLEMIGQREREG
jgi:hypothetical protein